MDIDDLKAMDVIDRMREMRRAGCTRYFCENPACMLHFPVTDNIIDAGALDFPMDAGHVAAYAPFGAPTPPVKPRRFFRHEVRLKSRHPVHLCDACVAAIELSKT